jgi:hypothetical protein
LLGAAEREATNVAGSVGSGRTAGGGEAYAAGHLHGTRAAEDEARRARQEMTSEGGPDQPES